MKYSSLKIGASLNEDCLILKVNINGNIMLHEKKLKSPNNIDISNMLLYWILNAVKPVFFSMPLDHFNFQISKELDQHDLKKMIVFCQQLILKTDALIKQYLNRCNAAKDNNGLLLYNCDSSHFYTNFYKYFEEADKEKTYYLNMKTGFDPLKRQWGEPEFPMSLEELVDYIMENKIKRVLSPNHYMIEHYFGKQHLYLLALFNFLGVEFIVIDNDNGDVSPEGYLIKKFFNYKGFKRLSFGFMVRNWFDKLNFDNSQITPTAADYKIDAPYSIEDDYQVLVISNSRATQVKKMLNPILYIMGQMDEDNLYEEYIMWFHSLRHLILDVMDLSQFERLYYGSKLFQFFYMGLQYMKFVVIDSISDEYNVKVYGDEGWGIALPKQYQNKWLNKDEIKAEMNSGRNIILPFNFTHSWPTMVGPGLTAISYNIPFLCWPAMVHTKEFEGFKRIEYKNAKELNAAIKDIKAIFQQPDLLESISFMKKIVSDNLTHLSNQLVGKNNDQGLIEDEYIQQFQKNFPLVDKKVKLYIESRDDFLYESFRVILQNKPLKQTVNLSDCSLFHKGYTQRLLQLK